MLLNQSEKGNESSYNRLNGEFNHPSTEKDMSENTYDRSDDTKNNYKNSTIKREEEETLSAKRLVDIKKL
jgi:hypothetical protein